MAAKLYPFKLNFTSGEISPKLHARMDLGQFKSGLETMENFIPYPHGGCYFRPGFHFVQEVVDSSKTHRLIPFQFSREQAYVLELGDSTVRFYKDRGIVLGYDRDEVDNHDFETAGGGGADVFGSWTESASDGAIEDGTTESYRGDACCKLTAGPTKDTYIASANIDVSAMSAGDAFSVKFWSKGDGTNAGRFGVYDVTNTTWIQTYTTTGMPTANYWTQVTYSDTIPSGCNDIAIYFQCPNLDAAYAYFDHVQLLDDELPVQFSTPYAEADLDELQWTQSADTLYMCHPDYKPRKILRYSHEDWGLEEISFTGPNLISVPEFDADAVWVKGTGWTISAGVATAAPGSASNLTEVDILEIGKTYTVVFTISNYAAGTITPYCGSGGAGTARSSNGTFTETIVCSGSDDFYFAKNAAADCDIDDAKCSTDPFNLIDNYPRSVTFHEERLFFAGTNTYPQRIWGSASGDYENLTTGVLDDDAVEYSIASDQVNVIEWLVPTTALLAGTAGGEFRVKGGTDDIITPTSISAKSISTLGVAPKLKGLRIGHVIIFIQTAGRKVYEMKFSFEEDSFIGNNIMLISEHLTEDAQIIDMVYQQEPDSILWCLLDDGTLLSCTYERTQQVIAWARHEVAGTGVEVESICTIPDPDGGADDLWICVKHTIDGGTVRYVEYLDNSVNGMDHFISYSGAATDTFTNLSHLEGEDVVVKGDGALYPDETVASGTIVLDETVSTLFAGLAFEGTVKTLRPAVEIQAGVAYGLTKSWNKIQIMLNESVGGSINGETLLLIDPEQEMGTAPDPYTGVIDMIELGWDDEAQITIVQDNPFPFILLAITGSLTVADEM
jgi:hypothetical protein